MRIVGRFVNLHRAIRQKAIEFWEESEDESSRISDQNIIVSQSNSLSRMKFSNIINVEQNIVSVSLLLSKRWKNSHHAEQSIVLDIVRCIEWVMGNE
jgi:hypothetical protein